MPKKSLTNMVATALRDAGYDGHVWTQPRKICGLDHTSVTRPSDGAYEYLTGYLSADAKVTQMTNGNLVVTWVSTP